MKLALCSCVAILLLAAPAFAGRQLHATDACANPDSFDKDQVTQSLLNLPPISLLNLPQLGNVPLNSDLLGVQYLGFHIGNFKESNISNFKNAVVSGNNAIFNLLGLTGTIAPLTNSVLTTRKFSPQSLHITPLFADYMTVRFTPYTGDLLALLQQRQPVDITIARSSGPTLINFSSFPQFKNISSLTVSSVKVVGEVPPNLLQLVNPLLPGTGVLNINQFGIDNVCIAS